MYGSQLQLIPWQCLLRTAPLLQSCTMHYIRDIRLAWHNAFQKWVRDFSKCRQVSYDDGAGGPFTTVTLTDNLQAWSVLRDGNVSMLSACGLNLDRSNTPRLDYQQVKPTGQVHDGQLMLKLQNCLRWIADLFRSVSLVVAAGTNELAVFAITHLEGFVFKRSPKPVKVQLLQCCVQLSWGVLFGQFQTAQQHSNTSTF